MAEAAVRGRLGNVGGLRGRVGGGCGRKRKGIKKEIRRSSRWEHKSRRERTLNRKLGTEPWLGVD